MPEVKPGDRVRVLLEGVVLDVKPRHIYVTVHRRGVGNRTITLPTSLAESLTVIAPVDDYLNGDVVSFEGGNVSYVKATRKRWLRLPDMAPMTFESIHEGALGKIVLLVRNGQAVGGRSAEGNSSGNQT